MDYAREVIGAQAETLHARKKSVREWINFTKCEIDPNCMLTLATNTSGELSIERAMRMRREFYSPFNTKLFGRKWPKKGIGLHGICITEKPQINLHFHILINLKSPVDPETVATEIWRKACPGGTAKVSPACAFKGGAAGLIDYCFKTAMRHDTIDLIDFFHDCNFLKNLQKHTSPKTRIQN